MFIHILYSIIGYSLINIIDSCPFVQFESDKLAIPLNVCMNHRNAKNSYYSTKYICSNVNSIIQYQRFEGLNCTEDPIFIEKYDTIEIHEFQCGGVECPFVSVRIYNQLQFEDSDSDCMDNDESNWNEYAWIIDYCFTNYLATKHHHHYSYLNPIPPNISAITNYLTTKGTHNDTKHHDLDLSMKIECGFDAVYLQLFKGNTCTKDVTQRVVYDQTCSNNTYWEILTCSDTNSLYTMHNYARVILLLLLTSLFLLT